MSGKHLYTSVVQASEKRKVAERQRLRHKIIFRWGILVFVGVFSFLYWFVFAPLVAPLLPANWFLLWPGFFVIWLIIIAPFVWLWKHKQEALVSLSCAPKKDIECPTFPTKVSTIQPSSEEKHNSPSLPQESCVRVPVQPGNVTPSLYNSQTGRDSFQSGYQVDEVPEKSSVRGEKTISRNNSGVQLSKKFDSDAKLMNSHRLISVSSSSSAELGGLDFKKIQRDPGDGLDAGERTELEDGEVEMQKGKIKIKETLTEEIQASHELLNNTSSSSCSNSSRSLSNDKSDVVDTQTTSLPKADANAIIKTDVNGSAKPEAPEIELAPLQREQSFKGLPEMQNFEEYLRLVTVDTPMSPRDVFFSDLGHSEPSKDNGEVRRQLRKSYHPGGDLSEVQRRIAEARKSLPPLLHYPDLEMGEVRVLKTKTLPQPAVLTLQNEQPVGKSYVRSVSEGRKTSWEATCLQARASGEYFVADATRLDSITSEVQMTINPGHGLTQLNRWETVVSGGNPGRGSSSKTDLDEPPEGRWVILSQDYASNNLEAFLRIEQEMMCRERSRATFTSEDADDSVFIEVGH